MLRPRYLRAISPLWAVSAAVFITTLLAVLTVEPALRQKPRFPAWINEAYPSAAVEITTETRQFELVESLQTEAGWCRFRTYGGCWIEIHGPYTVYVREFGSKHPGFGRPLINEKGRPDGP